jgi:hypothetical protein
VGLRYQVGRPARCEICYLFTYRARVGVSRVSRARFRPPSPVMTMLAGLRQQLSDGLANIGIVLKRIEADMARTAGSTANLAEAVDQLRHRITALERASGLCEAPLTPRVSRRRPLQ